MTWSGLFHQPTGHNSSGWRTQCVVPGVRFLRVADIARCAMYAPPGPTNAARSGGAILSSRSTATTPTLSTDVYTSDSGGVNRLSGRTLSVVSERIIADQLPSQGYPLHRKIAAQS